MAGWPPIGVSSRPSRRARRYRRRPLPAAPLLSGLTLCRLPTHRLTISRSLRCNRSMHHIARAAQRLTARPCGRSEFASRPFPRGLSATHRPGAVRMELRARGDTSFRHSKRGLAGRTRTPAPLRRSRTLGDPGLSNPPFSALPQFRSSMVPAHRRHGQFHLGTSASAAHFRRWQRLRDSPAGPLACGHKGASANSL